MAALRHCAQCARWRSRHDGLARITTHDQSKLVRLSTDPCRWRDTSLPVLNVAGRAVYPKMKQGITTAAARIFPNISFPVFTPERLYQLFMRHRDKATPPTSEEREEYLLLLMLLVAMNLSRRRWIETLDAGAGADSAVSSISYFLSQRSDRYSLRVPWESLSDEEGGLALVKSLNTSVFRKCLDLILTCKSRDTEEVAQQNSAEAMDQFVACPHVGDSDLQRMIEHLQSEECQDRICMKVPGDIFAIEEAVTRQISNVASGRDLVGYEDLSLDLREKVSPEVHSLCIARIVNEIEEFTSMVG